MASSGGNMERFAHDACVHVLEKFGIFKAPDDTRKQNEYVQHDFLPRLSRSVVSFAIWIRADFKNALEDRCKIADFRDNEIIWVFDDYLALSKFSEMHWTEKVCLSLALCTEYIQFAVTKDFIVSLNKLVIGWSNFFETHIRSYFEEKGGFSRLYDYLEISQIDQLGNFQEAFILEYCLPYGAIECTTELAKECIEKQGLNISLEETIFGIKNHEGEMAQVKLGDYPNIDLCAQLESRELKSCLVGSEEPKSEETSSGTSGSEEDSSDSSAQSDSEKSQNVGSDASDSEISQNNLLGIPPHEVMLREIDPFFVENIPSPPKARSSLKSSERESGPGDVPRSPSKSPEGESGSSDVPCSSSKSPEGESGAKDVPRSPSKSPEDESGTKDFLGSSSKSPEGESGSSDVPCSSSKSPEGESSANDVPRSSSKSPEGESGAKGVPRSSSKSPERESGPSDIPQSSSKFESVPSDVPRSSSKSPEGESGAKDVLRSSSKSPERESGPSDVPRSSSKSREGQSGPTDVPRFSSKSTQCDLGPRDASRSSRETEELKKSLEHIFSKLENDMDELRVLLFENGFLKMKSGSQMRVPTPEGLI